MQEIKKGQIWEHLKTGERVEVEHINKLWEIIILPCGSAIGFGFFRKNWKLVNEKEFTSTYSGNIDLEPLKIKPLFGITSDKVVQSVMKEQSISPHYNNDKGSLYQFCEDKQLNSYEFDIIKRVMRCRKKGQFIEDLEKTKFLIDLYIKEYDAQSN